jgi:hypothetical protein
MAMVAIVLIPLIPLGMTRAKTSDKYHNNIIVGIYHRSGDDLNLRSAMLARGVVSINHHCFSPHFWSYCIIAWGFCQPPILVVTPQREVKVAVLNLVQSDNLCDVEINIFLLEVVLSGILCHLLHGNEMVFIILKVVTILVIDVHGVSFLSFNAPSL